MQTKILHSQLQKQRTTRGAAHQAFEKIASRVQPDKHYQSAY